MQNPQSERRRLLCHDEDHVDKCIQQHDKYGINFDEYCPRTNECMLSADVLDELSPDNYCPSFFDAFLCWDAQPNGTVAHLKCPAGIMFEENTVASRNCLPNGTWLLRHDDGVFGGCDGATDMHSCYTQEFRFNYLTYNKPWSARDRKLIKHYLTESPPLIQIAGNSASAAAVIAAMFFAGGLKKRETVHAGAYGRMSNPLLVSSLFYCFLSIFLFVERQIRIVARSKDSNSVHHVVTDFFFACNVLFGFLEYFRLLLRVWPLQHMVVCYCKYQNQLALHTFNALVRYCQRGSDACDTDNNLQSLINVSFSRGEQQRRHDSAALAPQSGWLKSKLDSLLRSDVLFWFSPMPPILVWTVLKYVTKPQLKPCWLNYTREAPFLVVVVTELFIYVLAACLILKCVRLSSNSELNADRQTIKKMAAKHGIVLGILSVQSVVQQLPESDAIYLLVTQHVLHHALSCSQGLLLACAYFLLDYSVFLHLKRKLERFKIRIGGRLPTLRSKNRQGKLACVAQVSAPEASSSTMSRDRDSHQQSNVWYPPQNGAQQQVPFRW